MLVAVILASGKGTRLRPLSTLERPQQYLKLITGKTLVEDTVDRVRNLIPVENIFVVTNELQEKIAREALSDLPYENNILEHNNRVYLALLSYAECNISQININDVI